MVEDEFLATARAFTAHLHHAEYLRLKNAARARSEKLERPVDGLTIMRGETRKRKEGEVREEKLRGALDDMLAPEEGRRPSDGEEGSNFEDEGERHDDPWQGTQLQHFMTRSPKKAGIGMGVGLTGLQGVVSHTRAAAGFRKMERREGRRDGRGESPTATRGGEGVGDGDEEEEDEDTDDLDAPTYPRPRPRPPPSLTQPKAKPSQPAAVKHPPPSKTNAPRAFLDMKPLPKQQPPKPPPNPQPQPVIKREQEREQLVKFERSDSDRGEDVLRGIRERADARRRRRERGRVGGRAGGGVGKGADEIPVFLV